MKRFFAKHAKSSALALTLTLHAVLIVVATGDAVLVCPRERTQDVKKLVQKLKAKKKYKKLV